MPPTAFASSRPLPDDELAGAPVRYPRPSRLARELSVDGRKAAQAAGSLGLNTVGDLLEHLPRDRREARAVARLVPGESATVVVEVRAISSRPVRRRGMRPLVEATVADDSGPMKATFFNQPWLVQPLPGRDAPGPPRQVRGAQPLPRPGPRADRRGGGRTATRSRTTRRPRASRRPRSWRWSARTRARSPTSSSRSRRCCGPTSACPSAAARSPPSTSRATASRRSAGAGWRSRSCCSRSSRCCAGAGCAVAARPRRRSTASAS